MWSQKRPYCGSERLVLWVATVTGGTQPDVLQTLLGNHKDSNGKWARIMFVIQPNTASRLSPYNEKDVIKDELSKELNWLYREFDTQAAFVKNYRFSFDALSTFCEAYNEFEKQREHCANIKSSMAQVYGKSEGRIGKLAINLHVLKHVYAGNCTNIPEVIEKDVVDTAILLARFYIGQVDGVYTSLSGDAYATSPLLAKIISLAAKSTDGVTPREVNQSLSKQERGFYKTDSIKQMFQQLEKMGKGVCVEVGKSSIRFKTSVGSVGQMSVNLPTPLNPYVEGVLSNNNSSVGSVGHSSSFLNNYVSNYDTEVKETLSDLEKEKQYLTYTTYTCEKKAEKVAPTTVRSVGQLTYNEPTEPTLNNLPSHPPNGNGSYEKARVLTFEDGNLDSV